LNTTRAQPNARASAAHYAAVQHLIGYGHRRIGYLGDREDIWAVRER
jgi:DNA-binding LacI/PurR family transcriptional regulator